MPFSEDATAKPLRAAKQDGRTYTAAPALIVLAVFVVGLVVVLASTVSLDEDGRRGIIVGAGLGLLNLAVGYPVMRWALRRGMKTALTALSGGFIARLVVVAGLIVVFQRTGEADPTAFALTFLVFFFVYLGLELFLVDRSPD